jgi:diketogulonate reductase-like aldo/keto reductase
MLGRREFLSRSTAAAITLWGPHRLLAQLATTRATSSSMLKRKVPSTGEEIPVIGMGTWQTFDPPSLDDKSLAPLQDVLKTFYEAGGRVVDSSPMYGKSEEVTGMLAKRLKITDELFVATKVWTTGEQAGIDQMHNSMKKLGRSEKLDLMQIHNLLDWQTHIKTLRKWKDDGRIRYIGVTHYQLSAFDDLEKIIKNEKVDFVQLPYSLGVRDAEKRLLPAAKDKGVAVLVMRPFEGGNLFATARAKPLPDFVKPFASSWAQAFLKFILANDAVTAVLPATSKPQHMQDNTAAGTGRPPTAEEISQLVLQFK